MEQEPLQLQDYDVYYTHNIQHNTTQQHLIDVRNTSNNVIHCVYNLICENIHINCYCVCAIVEPLRFQSCEGVLLCHCSNYSLHLTSPLTSPHLTPHLTSTSV
jgi:hypothetical protein